MKTKSKRYHFDFAPRLFRRCSDEELLKIFPGFELSEIKAGLKDCELKNELVPIVYCDNWDPHDGCMGHPLK